MRVPLASANSELRRQNRRQRLWLVVILALAAALRLWGLGAKSLWLDEIMTVRNASGSLGGMIAELKKFDAHPPFFQIVEWLWLRLGEGDAFARAPAAIAGIAGVWLMWLVARRLLGRRVGLVAALLMALSFFHIYYSQEARLQTLVAAIFLGQIYLLLRLVEGRGRAGWKWWAAYGALGLVSLYTYALCVLTLAALALAYLWLTRRARREWAAWLVVHLLIGLLFLPWVPVMREITSRVQKNVQQRGDEVGRPAPEEIALSAASWAFGPPRWQRHKEFGCAIGVSAVLLAAFSLARRRARRPGKLLLVLFLLPLAGYLILPMPRVQLYDAKHLGFLQPLLLIGLASLAGGAVASGERAVLTFLLAPVLVLNLIGPDGRTGLRQYYSPEYQKEDWRRLVAEVAPQLRPDDAIYFSPMYVGFAFERYAGDAEAQARVHDMAVRGYEMRPEMNRLWLIECRSPVSYLDPDPERDEKAREAMLREIRARGWEERWSRTYIGSLGQLRWTVFLRRQPHRPGTIP